MNRTQALQQHLETDDQPEEAQWGENTFEIWGREYLVLTDEEADKAVEEEIERSLWAFRSGWLEHYCDVPEEALRPMQEKMCEAASPIIKRMIKDWDHFVEESVSADGRGHFLSPYDGCEGYENEGNDCFYIYRTN